jgi:glycosyltransferase involved in cell wall biosynthesis
MKILHLYNPAGIAIILAKYMDQIYGTKSSVVDAANHSDATANVGLSNNGEVLSSHKRIFALQCLLKSANFDLIHTHGYDRIVPYLKIVYPHKPVVLQYHGTDIRNRWLLRKQYWSKANLVLYSTKDLLEPETPSTAQFIYRPVDTEIFYPINQHKNKNTAIHFAYNANPLAQEYATQHNLKLTIHNRNEIPIEHLMMPKYLCQFEYYIDVKCDLQNKVIPALSKTGLEALACGLKVVRWDGKVVSQLPTENTPIEVVSKLMLFYEGVRN